MPLQDIKDQVTGQAPPPDDVDTFMPPPPEEEPGQTLWEKVKSIEFDPTVWPSGKEIKDWAYEGFIYNIARNVSNIPKFLESNVEQQADAFGGQSKGPLKLGLALLDRVTDEMVRALPEPTIDPSQLDWTKQSPRTIIRDIIKGGPLMGVFVAASAINPILGTAVMAGVEGGDVAAELEEYEKRSGTTLDKSRKNLAIQASGIINAAIEHLSINQMFKGKYFTPYVKSKLAKIILNVPGQGLEEGVQGVVSVLSKEYAIENPDMLESLRQQTDEIMSEVFAGGSLGLLGIPGIASSKTQWLKGIDTESTKEKTIISTQEINENEHLSNMRDRLTSQIDNASKYKDVSDNDLNKQLKAIKNMIVIDAQVGNAPNDYVKDQLEILELEKGRRAKAKKKVKKKEKTKAKDNLPDTEEDMAMTELVESVAKRIKEEDEPSIRNKIEKTEDLINNLEADYKVASDTKSDEQAKIIANSISTASEVLDELESALTDRIVEKKITARVKMNDYDKTKELLGNIPKGMLTKRMLFEKIGLSDKQTDKMWGRLIKEGLIEPSGAILEGSFEGIPSDAEYFIKSANSIIRDIMSKRDPLNLTSTERSLLNASINELAAYGRYSSVKEVIERLAAIRDGNADDMDFMEKGSEEDSQLITPMYGGQVNIVGPIKFHSRNANTRLFKVTIYNPATDSHETKVVEEANILYKGLDEKPDLNKIADKGDIEYLAKPPKTSLDLMSRYPDLTKSIVSSLSSKYPGVVANQLNRIFVRQTDRGWELSEDERPLSDGWIEKLGFAYRNMAAWAKTDGDITAPPHEYAHVYINALKYDHKLVQDAIRKFGGGKNGEERLAQHIANYYVKKSMEPKVRAWMGKWLRSFWLLSKRVFSKITGLDTINESIENIVADHFWSGKDAGLFNERASNMDIGMADPNFMPAKHPVDDDFDVLEGKSDFHTQTDISTWKKWILGSEFIINKFQEKLIKKGLPTEGAKIETASNAIRKLIEADQRYQYRLHKHYALFDKFMGLPKKKQIEITKAMELIRSGWHSKVKDPETIAAAQSLNDWFDHMRERVKGFMKEMYHENLSPKLAEAFTMAQNGDSIEAIKEATNIDPLDLRDLLDNYFKIDEWGLDDYIPKIEVGIYRITRKAQSEGKEIRQIVGVAPTARQAGKKLEALRNETGESSLRIERPSSIQRGQEFEDDLFYINLPKGYKDVIKAMIRKEFDVGMRDINKYLKGFIEEVEPGTGPKPLSKRKDILLGEENIFKIIHAYASVIERKLSIEPDIIRVKKEMDVYKEFPGVVDLVEDEISEVRGKYYGVDKAVDGVIEAFNDAINTSRLMTAFHETELGKKLQLRVGGKGNRASRALGEVRKLQARLKLGYRVVAAMINEIDGLSHIWIKTSIPYMMKAQRAWISDPTMKEMLERNRGYMGMGLASEHQTKQVETEPVWKPLGMFQLPESHIRPLGFAANFLMSKDEGMSDEQAEMDARYAVRTQLFLYNSASLPKLMRGPVGKTVFQFKPYLIQEVQFIRNLKPKQFAKYMVRAVALGGIKGAVMLTASIPVLSLFIDLDDVYEWLDRTHPDVARASRGIFGMFGVDVTAPAIVQFPQTPMEWLGPSVSDASKFWQRFIAPERDGSEEVWNSENYHKYVTEIAPVAMITSSFMQSFIDENGWVRDPYTNAKLYKADDIYKRASIAMGMTPIDKSQMSTLRRVTDKRRKALDRDRTFIANKIIKHVLDAKKADDIDDWRLTMEDLMSRYQLYGGTPDGLQSAQRYQEVPPEWKEIMKARQLEKLDIYKWLEDLGIFDHK